MRRGSINLIYVALSFFTAGDAHAISIAKDPCQSNCRIDYNQDGRPDQHARAAPQ